MGISKKPIEEEVEKSLEVYEKELGARPKQFKFDLNKEIDLELLNREKYNTPQEVFDFFHSKSKDPDKND